MTGQPVPGETIPSPNNTPINYNIGGTDLGIFWKMSDNKVGILFGDTYGKAWQPGHTPEWRSNAMAWSSDYECNGMESPMGYQLVRIRSIRRRREYLGIT